MFEKFPPATKSKEKQLDILQKDKDLLQEMSDVEQQQVADDLAFDPSVKKKKKSNKPKAVKFDQDAANLEDAGDADDVLELGTQVKQTSLGNDVEEGDAQDGPAADEAEDVDDFDFSTAKKKYAI